MLSAKNIASNNHGLSNLCYKRYEITSQQISNSYFNLIKRLPLIFIPMLMSFSMKNDPQDWRSTIIVTCSFAIVFVAFVWSVRKNSSEKEKQPKKVEKEKPDIVNGTISHGNDANDEPEEEEQTNDDAISELPDPNWVKVGQVRELYIYPLKSGRGKELRECDFTGHGISVENQGFTLRDR